MVGRCGEYAVAEVREDEVGLESWMSVNGLAYTQVYGCLHAVFVGRSVRKQNNGCYWCYDDTENEGSTQLFFHRSKYARQLSPL